MESTDNNVKKVAAKVAKNFLKNENLRKYTVDNNWEPTTYTLEMEISEENDALVITTWGYDYERLYFPTNWGELVNMKMRASFGWMPGPKEIAYNFYYQIMKEFN